MSDPSDWLDSFADALDVARLDDETRSLILDLARDVAHGTERKNAPLAAFLAGRHAEDKDGAAGLNDAVEAARRLLSGGEQEV